MSKSMQLSKETIKTLKKVYDVNQSLRIVEDEETLRVQSTNGDMMLIAPIEEKFPRDINIYNLQEFLAVLGIIEDAELDLSKDNLIKIHSKDKKQKLIYMDSDPDFINSYQEKTPVMKNPEIKVSVTETQLETVLDARKSMSLENVGFTCDGEKIFLVAFNKNNGDQNYTNQFSVEIGEGDTVFEMFYKYENIKLDVLLKEGDLEFEITSAKISKITCASGKVFWIAMNAKSNYGDA